jgi:hypothetical protein
MSHKACKQSTSLNERQCLTELTVICATAAAWGKPTCQSGGLVSVCRNQSREVKTTALNWVITKVKMPNNETVLCVCSTEWLSYCPFIAGTDVHQVALGEWHRHDGHKPRLSGVSVGAIAGHRWRKSRLSGVSVGAIAGHQVLFTPG